MKLAFSACAVSLALASIATADTYYFDCVSNNSAANAAAGESQLRMDVTDPGSSRVNFRFYWVGSVAMSICDIYFDDQGTNGPGVLGVFTDSDISASAGVSFSQGASPGHLPSGGNFQTSSGLLTDSDSPVAPKGINAAYPTEYLDVSIPLLSGSSFADALAALNQGFIDSTHRGLRVGLHVQSIYGGNSESFVNEPNEPGDPGQATIVPLPPAAWAGLSTLALVAGVGLRRRKSS